MWGRMVSTLDGLDISVSRAAEGSTVSPEVWNCGHRRDRTLVVLGGQPPMLESVREGAAIRQLYPHAVPPWPLTLRLVIPSTGQRGQRPSPSEGNLKQEAGG